MKKTSPYGRVKFKNIDQYHDSFPGEIKVILDHLRNAIRQVAPQAREIISYNIPTFKMNKNLVHYAAYKEHIGFYPTASPILVFKDKLSEYITSKGAIQFPIDKPLPITLIKEIVRFRVAEDNEKSKTKPAGKPAK